jgi:hypothetical protein
MAYSKELQETVDKLGLKKDNILYLTLENQYMQQMREGAKDTEYREGSEFLLSRLFLRNKAKKFQLLKPKTHVLFQGGYNPDSARLLIELKGFSVGNQNFPPDTELKTGYRLYEDVEIYLGNIHYDSLDFPGSVPVFKRAPKKAGEPDKPAEPRKKPVKKSVGRTTGLPEISNSRRAKISGVLGRKRR